MSLILGSPLAKCGYDVVAIDNLGFGMTSVAPGFAYTYDDWVRMVIDLLAAESTRDTRPVVLYGLSAGGMLAYHVAAAAPRGTIKGIVGMTFLDPRVQKVRDQASRDIVTARLGLPLMNFAAKTPLASFLMPMPLAVKMSALANSCGAMKVFLADRTSAANSASIRFLSSYMNYVPAVEPEDFDACPVLLTQPGDDRRTSYDLSVPVLSKIKHVEVEEVTLENAGHYPLEDPGLQQMLDAIDDFIQRAIR